MDLLASPLTAQEEETIRPGKEIAARKASKIAARKEEETLNPKP